MAVFLGILSFVLCLIMIAVGLILLHHEKKNKGGLLKLAAFILIIGGIIFGMNTGYHYLKYHFKGEFDTIAGKHYKKGYRFKDGKGLRRDGNKDWRKKHKKKKHHDKKKDSNDSRLDKPQENNS